MNKVIKTMDDGTEFDVKLAVTAVAVGTVTGLIGMGVSHLATKAYNRYEIRRDRKIAKIFEMNEMN